MELVQNYYSFALLIIGLIAYFIGAIPTGYIIARLFAGIDITCHGSGNIGASNSARVLGKPCFFLVLLIDAGKAFGAYWLFSYFSPTATFLNYSFIGACLLIGNAYSCFIGFKGGKGVATALGIIAYLFPAWITAIFVIVWAFIFVVMRNAPLASITSLSCAMAAVFGRLLIVHQHYENLLALCGFVLFLYCFVLFRHRRDIAFFLGLEHK